MAAFLGIDIGTSATKVLALSEEGRTLAVAKRGYLTRTPATNWAEQSAGDWWRATVESVAEVIAGIGDTPIAAVGLSGQLNGFVLTDTDGTPLHDALIWLDLRAVAEARALADERGDEITTISGNPISPVSVMAKLLWMRRHRPELLAGAQRLFLVKDYVLWRLTGVHATDPSDASAINLMDLARMDWSEELCRAVGVEPGLMPPIVSSTAIVGRVHRAASGATGIPEGVPVVPGGGDVAALATGCGVIGEGVLGLTLGTAGHVVLSSRARLPADRSGVWEIVHMAEGRTVWLGLVMSGGLSLSWLHRTMGLGRAEPSFDDFVALAGDAEPGARGLTFLPFLEGAATPYDRPEARAAFSGLTSSHGASEMIQAVMEGVAFNLRECVELFERLGANVSEVRLAEGGSRLARWCQTIADVLGRPVNLIDQPDTSALGAAMAAQAGLRAVSLETIAAGAVRTGRRFDPSEAASAYESAYRRYRALARSALASD